jgi:hypothetical protein
MPIIPGTATATVGPYGTSKCRPVRIRASGEASAIAATGAGATREARAEARRMLDRAVRRVRTIRCPRKGGCAAGCQQGRTLKIAWGTRLWPAEQRADGRWEASVRHHQFYYMICRCPG